MKIRPIPRTLRRLGAVAAAALVLGTAATATSPAAEGGAAAPYSVEVGDVSTPVGSQTALVATLRLRDGYRFLKSYNNRVIRLSSLDDGVAFEREVVRGTLDEDRLVFRLNVSPTKPGRHPINGVVRLGYAEGNRSMKMVSVPLMATVTGTE